MNDGPINAPTRGRNTLVEVRSQECDNDRQLLNRFVSCRDEAAFAVLVERHAPMVLSVCGRVLHDAGEAEDACQATFFVLARKAGSLRQPELLANWLYGVAYRAARKAQRQMARRGTGVMRGAPMRQIDPTPEIIWHDLRPILDAELRRLPAKYRTAVVLCYLEGLTAEAAARHIGCPRGTILSRLARARELLRSRLARRGLGLSVGILGLVLAQFAFASPSPSAAFVYATTRAALQFAAGPRASTGASSRAAEIARAVLTGALLIKLTGAVICLLAVGVLAVLGWRMGPGGATNEATDGLVAGVQPTPGTQEAKNPEQAPNDDTQQLQGAWRGVTLEQLGQRPIASERITFTFTGDQLKVDCRLFAPPWNQTYEFRLDSTAHPKTIDLATDGKIEMLGIYEIRGDTLTLCTVVAGHDRPTEFAAKDTQLLWVFKRDPLREGLP